MRFFAKFIPVCCGFLGLILPVAVQAGEWSGFGELEGLLFNQAPLQAPQKRAYFSLAFQPEYYQSWDEGRQSLTFVPFFRFDEADKARRHWDIRELDWQLVRSHWELRAGIRKVYWGVAESVHLVDIINQTDVLENPDGEDKLGQPMVNFAWVGDWGTLDFFLLTGFRERRYPGNHGRLRLPQSVASQDTVYASSREEAHVDWAVRYTQSSGPIDMGISHFSGTSREPILLPRTSAGGQVQLVPFYDLIDQTGLDIQATLGGWLLKLESIYRRESSGDRFSALVAGFEYTFGNIGNRGIDLGLLAELIYDDRDTMTAFSNDWFFGFRLAMNDVQSSQLLVGVITSRDHGGNLLNIEAERRFGARWKMTLEARGYGGTSPGNALYAFRQDQHLRLAFAHYF